MDSGAQLSEKAIVQALSEQVCQQLTRKAIMLLQKINMKDALLSGEESGLHNTWDEICVQFQDEFSFYWDVYELTIREVIESEVEELKAFEREAIWLQTQQGDDWDSEDETDRKPYPVYNEDIIEYLLRTYIYKEADSWTNKHIRAYLDRISMRD